MRFELGNDVDVVFAAGGDEATPSGTEQLRRLGECESRKGVKQRQLGTLRRNRQAQWQEEG
jgi:hypothetical protein